MEATGHFVRKFKLPSNGDQMRFLYSEATVTNTLPAPDGESVFATAILSESVMKKFQAQFGGLKKVSLKKQ